MVAAVIGGQAAERNAVGQDIGDRSRLIAKIYKVRVGELLKGMIAGLLQTEDGELLRMRHRQGPQYESVDDAEDGSVDGDAERESHDGYGREPRGIAKRTEGVAQILPEARHSITSWDWPWESGANVYPIAKAEIAHSK
jgi:hypothetical protein